MSSQHLLLSLLLFLLPSLVAHADPPPINRAFQVGAVVANGCALGTAINNNAYDLGTLSLGTLGNLASPVSAASSSRTDSVVLACTPGMTVSITLDYGVNGDSSSQRCLKRMSGNEALTYRPYQGTAYSQVWGNGTLARTTANFPTGIQTYTVCARLFAVDSLPSAGNYRSAVTVTLLF